MGPEASGETTAWDAEVTVTRPIEEVGSGTLERQLSPHYAAGIGRIIPP
jgi:hypothetical protein